MPFYAVSASEFVEMFVGRGAARVRELFSTARKYVPLPCIRPPLLPLRETRRATASRRRVPPPPRRHSGRRKRAVHEHEPTAFQLNPSYTALRARGGFRDEISRATTLTNGPLASGGVYP